MDGYYFLVYLLFIINVIKLLKISSRTTVKYHQDDLIHIQVVIFLSLISHHELIPIYRSKDISLICTDKLNPSIF